MKLRIRGNSVRLRVGQSEVRRLAAVGLLEESTRFDADGDQILTYRLISVPGSSGVSASFESGTILVRIPADVVRRWASSSQVGIAESQALGESGQLKILVEKDFECIDGPPDELQDDAYPHPGNRLGCRPEGTSLGGIVLCGGVSSRFGSPKALLAFGAETMLERVVRRLGTVVAPIVVVAARDQPLPQLPPQVVVLRDREPSSGPLDGLRTGLAALEGHCQAAYLTGCDTPLLVPAFACRLHELLGDHDIAAPEVNGIIEPLAAVYCVRLLGLIDQLLTSGHAGPTDLVRRASTRIVTANELRQVDPQLDTLMDVDEPKDYQEALQRAGLAIHGATQPEGFRP